MGWDTDPWMEQEALEDERLWADMEQAEMEAAERAGRCTHGSAAGYHDPPLYPEQHGLKPGQLACTKHTGGCQAVFDSDEDWHAAMHAAVHGN